MKHLIATTLLATLISLFLGGCGTARMVRSDAHGGTVSLQGAYGPRTMDARLLMSNHCQGPYMISSRANGGDAIYPAPGQDQVTFRCEPEWRNVTEVASR